MDFTSGSPKERKGNYVIKVVVDRFKKFILFLLIKMMDFMDKLAKLYVNKVIRLHGVLISIVLD
jgi:hypothetical protein